MIISIWYILIVLSLIACIFETNKCCLKAGKRNFYIGDRYEFSQKVRVPSFCLWVCFFWPLALPMLFIFYAFAEGHDAWIESAKARKKRNRRTERVFKKLDKIKFPKEWSE